MTTAASFHFTFGVELEMTHSKKVPQQISEELCAAGINARLAKRSDKDYTYWHVTTDGSIRCAPHQPQDCSRFEVVSPILQGERGLEELEQVVRQLTKIEVEVNESCGCHVHLGLGVLQLKQLKQVALAFVMLEEAVFDQVVPTSRRADKSRYCRSNRQRLLRPSMQSFVSTPNDKILDAMSVGDLAWAIQGGQDPDTPDARYYKMNLMPLREIELENARRYLGLNVKSNSTRDCKSTPKPTIEFRQLGATRDASEICNWVRLLQRFVDFAIVDFQSCDELVKMQKSPAIDSRFRSFFIDAVQLFPRLGQLEASDNHCIANSGK